MMLTKKQVNRMKDLFPHLIKTNGIIALHNVIDLVDTIDSQSTQIEQLKAQAEAVSISFKELLRICDNIANDGRGFVHGVSWNILEHAKQALEAIEKNSTT
jgi:Ca2+-binding EF-hand superfamily protein